ncbi:hypothetical protein R3P38DRAFT_3341152 [Favolaschia claudopus]|uniref:Uncharacterized protein n=1 Tax=Favolaschia claudopus TaxID=2862362 RepID=A0AAW0E582_9AGAR
MERIRILSRNKKDLRKTSASAFQHQVGKFGAEWREVRLSEFERERGLEGKAARCHGIGERAGGTPRAAATAMRVEGGIGARDIIEGVESDVESEMGGSGERRGLEENLKNIGKRGGGALFALKKRVLPHCVTLCGGSVKATRRRSEATRRGERGWGMSRAFSVGGGDGIGNEGAERTTVDFNGEVANFNRRRKEGESIEEQGGRRVVTDESGGRDGSCRIRSSEVGRRGQGLRVLSGSETVVSGLRGAVELWKDWRRSNLKWEPESAPSWMSNSAAQLAGLVRREDVRQEWTDNGECTGTRFGTFRSNPAEIAQNHLRNDIRTACDFVRVVSFQIDSEALQQRTTSSMNHYDASQSPPDACDEVSAMNSKWHARYMSTAVGGAWRSNDETTGLDGETMVVLASTSALSRILTSPIATLASSHPAPTYWRGLASDTNDSYSAVYLLILYKALKSHHSDRRNWMMASAGKWVFTPKINGTSLLTMNHSLGYDLPLRCVYRLQRSFYNSVVVIGRISSLAPIFILSTPPSHPTNVVSGTVHKSVENSYEVLLSTPSECLGALVLSASTNST